MAQENGGPTAGCDRHRHLKLVSKLDGRKAGLPAVHFRAPIESAPAEEEAVEEAFLVEPEDPDAPDPLGEWCFVVSAFSRCPECDEMAIMSRVLGVAVNVTQAREFVGDYVKARNEDLDKRIAVSDGPLWHGLQRLRLELRKDGLGADDHNGAGMIAARKAFGRWVEDDWDDDDDE